MSDIVERLRRIDYGSAVSGEWLVETATDAATEIERLRDLVAKLQAIIDKQLY